MASIKQNIYEVLSGVSGVTVYQRRPDIIKSFPSVTFYVAEDRGNFTLAPEITHRNLVIVVDVWTKSSIESSEISEEIIDVMLLNGYLLDFSTDVDNPDNIAHVSMRFKFIYTNHGS